MSMRQGARLLDVQQRYRELGRLRMGKKAPSGAPQKLDVWRLTSPAKGLLERAAGLYGGTVARWADAPDEGEWWELVTESATLAVTVPPGEVLTQYWEQWSGGGCKKRCDGVNQILVDRKCSCPSDIAERLEKAQKGGACKPTTRLSVMLRGIPDIGVWRLETHGMNAAQELPGTYDVLRRAAEVGALLPARLTIQARHAKRDGKTQRFKVPVLELEHTVDELATGIAQLGAGEGSQAVGELPAAPPPVERKNMPPTGAALHTDPDGSGNGTDDATWQPPETRAPLPEPPDDEAEPEDAPVEIPQWIAELPGTEAEICAAATEVSKELGKPQEIWSVQTLAQLPISKPAQKAIRAKLQPVQGSLT